MRVEGSGWGRSFCGTSQVVPKTRGGGRGRACFKRLCYYRSCSIIIFLKFSEGNFNCSRKKKFIMRVTRYSDTYSSFEIPRLCTENFFCFFPSLAMIS